MTIAPDVQSPEYVDAWKAWHAGREQAAGSAFGISTLTGTHWLTDEPQQIDGLPGTFVFRDGKALGEAAGIELAPGEEAEVGDVLLKAILPRPGQPALRVFDPAAPTRTKGLGVFDPKPEWAVVGRFEPAAPESSIAITHADGVTTEDRLSGTIHVDLAGQHLHLSAWPSPAGPGRLELTFADASNGATTKQFRFLTTEAPDADGSVVLDFNQAYLPPCSLGTGYLCPIPPAENRLPFTVEAGETFPIL